jgi:hypothetical protein
LRCAGEEVLCLCHELAVPTFVILKKKRNLGAHRRSTRK